MEDSKTTGAKMTYATIDKEIPAGIILEEMIIFQEIVHPRDQYVIGYAPIEKAYMETVYQN